MNTLPFDSNDPDSQLPAVEQAENLDGFSSAAELLDHRDKMEKLIHQVPPAYLDYCYVKARAMTARVIGDITYAMRMERECDAIYRRLPEDWKW